MECTPDKQCLPSCCKASTEKRRTGALNIFNTMEVKQPSVCYVMRNLSYQSASSRSVFILQTHTCGRWNAFYTYIDHLNWPDTFRICEERLFFTFNILTDSIYLAHIRIVEISMQITKYSLQNIMTLEIQWPKIVGSNQFHSILTSFLRVYFFENCVLALLLLNVNNSNKQFLYVKSYKRVQFQFTSTLNSSAFPFW